MLILLMERNFVSEGDPHRYVVGAWNFMKVAIEQGQKEYRRRGGKYEVIILETDDRGVVTKKYDYLGKPLKKVEAEKIAPHNTASHKIPNRNGFILTDGVGYGGIALTINDFEDAIQGRSVTMEDGHDVKQLQQAKSTISQLYSKWSHEERYIDGFETISGFIAWVEKQ